MKLTKPLSLLILLFSALLAGSLVVSCSYKGKKEAPLAARQPSKIEAPPAAAQPPEKKPALVSVDFDNAPLAEVVAFMTSNTGTRFIINGKEQKTISWTEYKIPHENLLNAFTNALQASGLILKPMDPQKTAFIIDKAEEPKVPYRLDFATCSKGVFFLFGDTVISKDKFQYPLKYASGQWYAMIPKGLVEQFEASKRPAKPELASTQTKKANENQ